MEKKFAQTGSPSWKHNTRIWVAFDSPNLGANVPLGDQALIKILGNDNVDAQKSFNKLQAVAASELLINSYKEYNTENQNTYFTDGSTTSQGLPVNKGNQYFQEHYNNQFGNGLPNSNGFPMNLRKLAIVNGSLSGETFGNGYEKMLDIRLFKTVCIINWTIGGWQPSSCFTSKLFQAETYTVPTVSNIVARTEKLIAFSANEIKPFAASANSIRGIMDNVPGGAIDATGKLYTAITGVPAPGARSFWQYTAAAGASFYYNHIGTTPEWETRNLKSNQCFIPTFSGIGMKNPNQNWANPLNRNLVCSNETYFDSYYGEANNTAHVELNYRSVNWLLKELGSSTAAPAPQAPVFPLEVNLLTGPNVICLNTNSTFSLGSDICKLPSAATWSVTPAQNAQIISSTSLSVILKGLVNGSCTITATFQNGQTVTKTIWVGKPVFDIQFNLYEPQPIKSHICIVNGAYGTTLAQQSVTNYTFKRCNSSTIFPNTTNNYCVMPGVMPGAPCCFEVTVTNICGSTTVFYNDCFSNDRAANTNTNLYRIYPNPSNSLVSIDLFDQELKPELKTPISGELFDMFGFSRSKVEIVENKANFSVVGLPKGIYILKINVNDKVESHQIAVE